MAKTSDKPIPVQISTPLHKRLKIAAAELGCTMRELSDAALEDYFAQFEIGTDKELYKKGAGKNKRQVEK